MAFLRPTNPARGQAAALLLGAAALAGMLLLFPPERYGFWPACPFYAATGKLCPGCGATRALAALLHGNWAQAIGLNGLVVLVVLPLATVAVAFALSRGRWPLVSSPAIYVALVVGLLFAVIRNLI